jgi:OOP family OmpA-OmpF porin
MTRASRIKERGLLKMIFVLLVIFLAAHFYSAKAQEIQANNFNPESLVSNTGKNIHLTSNLNKEARAVPLHASINSPYAELKPVLTPDGSRLYFSRSFHPDNTFGIADEEDIWYSNFDKTSDTWSDAVRMTGLLNNAGPNYINNVSITGDTIILGNQYGKKARMRAGVSYSVNVDGQWSAPVSIDILNDYNMSAHSNSFVSLKTGVIIRAIERAETFGERDLYVSFWDGAHATEAINMGSVINTPLEESSPFLAADNKTLYFASKGHAGFGGFDIFVTHRLDDSWTNWSAPENLGPAVNGELDDDFFSLSPCGKFATFSKQVSVHNVDLFKISIEDLFGQPASQKGTPSFASL